MSDIDTEFRELVRNESRRARETWGEYAEEREELTEAVYPATFVIFDENNEPHIIDTPRPESPGDLQEIAQEIGRSLFMNGITPKVATFSFEGWSQVSDPTSDEFTEAELDRSYRELIIIGRSRDGDVTSFQYGIEHGMIDDEAEEKKDLSRGEMLQDLFDGFNIACN